MYDVIMRHHILRRAPLARASSAVKFNPRFWQQTMQNDACPLFTPRHANHSAVWTVPGFSIPRFCLACATERLEDKGQISLHHKRVLGELQALLAAGNSTFLQALSSDKRVLEHLSFVVFGECK